MKTLLFSLMMTTSPEAEVDARTLYQEGTTLFEAADYGGAIEKFTAALAIAKRNGGDDHVRLTLLYNIASAHEKQFKIDKDVSHLRQALDLYKRYREFAHGKGSSEDIFDVEGRIASLETRVRVAEQMERSRRETHEDAEREVPPPPPSGAVPQDTDWKGPRNTGVGLVVAGGAATVGGIVLAAVGSRFEPRARAQVSKLADMGVPMDHPAWDEGDEFIEQERTKGRALIGVGVSLSVVGAVGVGVGSYYLVRSKKLKEHEVSITPSFGAGAAGIQIGGRF